MNIRYLVSFDIQRSAIDALCFGSCKKILIGAVDIQGMVFFACDEKDCPHLASQLSEPTVLNHYGYDYYLRKLKEESEIA